MLLMGCYGYCHATSRRPPRQPGSRRRHRASPGRRRRRPATPQAAEARCLRRDSPTLHACVPAMVWSLPGLGYRPTRGGPSGSSPGPALACSPQRRRRRPGRPPSPPHLPGKTLCMHVYSSSQPSAARLASTTRHGLFITPNAFLLPAGPRRHLTRWAPLRRSSAAIRPAR